MAKETVDSKNYHRAMTLTDRDWGIVNKTCIVDGSWPIAHESKSFIYNLGA